MQRTGVRGKKKDTGNKKRYKPHCRTLKFLIDDGILKPFEQNKHLDKIFADIENSKQNYCITQKLNQQKREVFRRNKLPSIFEKCCGKIPKETLYNILEYLDSESVIFLITTSMTMQGVLKDCLNKFASERVFNKDLINPFPNKPKFLKDLYKNSQHELIPLKSLNSQTLYSMNNFSAKHLICNLCDFESLKILTAIRGLKSFISNIPKSFMVSCIKNEVILWTIKIDKNGYSAFIIKKFKYKELKKLFQLNFALINSLLFRPKKKFVMKEKILFNIKSMFQISN